jgi:hypothetical protein
MAERKSDPSKANSGPDTTAEPPPKPAPASGEREIGGPKGPEPTRYGDWEINGRCSDF